MKNKHGPAKGAKESPRTALWVVLGPLLGLMYVVLIPLIGLFALAFLAVRALERAFRPSRAGVVYPDGGLSVEKAGKKEGEEG